MNMKRFSLIAMSLMSISLLASCGNSSEATPNEPTYTVHIEYDSQHCSVSDDTLIGTAGSSLTFTIEVTDDDYDITSEGFAFVNGQGEDTTYDGSFNYNYDTKEVSVTIGSKDITLKCTPVEKTYRVDIETNCCSTSETFLVGAYGTTHTFTVTPNDGYVFSESRLGFVNDQGQLTSDYDGECSYDDNTKTVTVTIGKSNIKLVCFAYKVYQVNIAPINCTISGSTIISGPSEYSTSFTLTLNPGCVLKNDSFSWVNTKGETINDYNGRYSYDDNSSQITIWIGDGDATFKCTAYQTHTIKISATNCATVGKTEFVDINNAEVTFELAPNKENGYTLEDDCFSWVDDGGQVIANYDGSYSYDKDKNTMIVTVGNGDATLKCTAKKRTSTVDIRVSGNCSTTQEKLTGVMGDKKSFTLNVVVGNTVTFTFIPATTKASTYMSGNVVTVTIGNDDVILSCSTSPTTYNWSIPIILDGSFVPSVTSISGRAGDKVEFSYTLGYGYDFTDPALNFSNKNTGTTYELKGDDKIVITFGVGGGIITPNVAKRWYKFTDWWNYCSTKKDNIPIATKDDIGRIVPVTLTNGVTHDVRLIDISHDYLASDNDKYAHCSFEFYNVLTKEDGSAYTFHWGDSVYDDWAREIALYNEDFFESEMHKILQPGGDVYKLFPTGNGSLLNKMTTVTKYVGYYYDPWWNPFQNPYWINEDYDTKLFHLSVHETINEDDIYGVMDYEGYIYTYHKNNTSNESRVKYTVPVKGKSSKSYYWLRSPSKILSSGTFEYRNYGFVIINSGGLNEEHCAVYRPVAPGFCI